MLGIGSGVTKRGGRPNPIESEGKQSAGGVSGHSTEVVENPLSGERITIVCRNVGPEANALVWDLVLGPGGRVPSSHIHPRQQECFTVLDGELHFRVGWRRLEVRQGESVTVAPGRVHSFANQGRVPIRVRVETVPALDMEDLLRTAAVLAQDQYLAGKRLPRLVDLVLFMQEFKAEVASPWIPGVVVIICRPAAYLARLIHADRRYRRLRQSCGSPTVGHQA
jgi:mannose-6-phosphate isomerase-like protein (cupin superfamily)